MTTRQAIAKLPNNTWKVLDLPTTYATKREALRVAALIIWARGL